MPGPWPQVLIAAGLLLPLAATTQPLGAQGTESSCKLEGKVYHCSWSAFRTAFHAADTLAVESRDPAAERQLRDFVHGTRKALVAGPGQNPDLTLVVARVDNGGISIGPADMPLVVLRVYGPSSGAAIGPLLWSETLTGKGDIPWPSQVHLLLEQFKDRFSEKH